MSDTAPSREHVSALLGIIFDSALAPAARANSGGSNRTITVFHELQEMRYLWRNDHRLDNSELVAVLGSEPHVLQLVAIASATSHRVVISSQAMRGRNDRNAGWKAIPGGTGCAWAGNRK